VITTFNDHCFNNSAARPYGLKTYKGVTAINGFFTALFEQLGKKLENINHIGPKGEVAAGEGAPVVKEAGASAPNGNVFLTWRTVDSLAKPIDLATDSFSFKKVGEKYLVKHQTIVSTETKSDCPPEPEQSATTGGAKIYQAWDNHFSAFGGKNVTQIMEDYDEGSIVQVWDNTKKAYSEYQGLTKISEMFTKLFADIKAGDVGSGEGIEVGMVEIDPVRESVFLAWESNSFPKATDTFFFNGEIIARQNIVVSTKASVAERFVV